MYKTKLKDTKHLQRHERARKRKENNLSPGIYLGDEGVLTLFLIYTRGLTEIVVVKKNPNVTNLAKSYMVYMYIYNCAETKG